MPEHHRRKARPSGIDGELGQIVQYQDVMSAGCNDGTFWQRGGPRLRIDVASDGNDARHAAQLLENCSLTDIAGMDDHCRSAQRIDRLGAEETMRIGDDADEHETSLR